MPVKQNNAKKYISYRRVSTKTQGLDGYGMKAQAQIIGNFIKRVKGQLIEDFAEVASGTKRNRTALINAIDESKRANATLIVSSLDRLSRSAAHIYSLLEDDFEMEICDIPGMDRLTIGVKAAVFEHERKLIGDRIRQAGLHKKRKSNPIGPTYKERKKALEARRKNMDNDNVVTSLAVINGIISQYREKKQSLSVRMLLSELRSAGTKSQRGKEWTFHSLTSFLRRRGISPLPKFNPNIDTEEFRLANRLRSEGKYLREIVEEFKERFPGEYWSPAKISQKYLKTNKIE